MAFGLYSFGYRDNKNIESESESDSEESDPLEEDNIDLELPEVNLIVNSQ